MFNTKTIILAKALRPDLNFASPGAEELVWLKIASRYASGNPVRDATISNGIAYFDRVSVSQPLVSLKLNIPVTQTGSGTPSPDNIRDIVGVQGVNVSRTGKNLFSGQNITERSYITSSGDIKNTGGWNVSDYIPVSANTVYTFTPNTTGGNMAHNAFYDSNKNLLGVSPTSNFTFTTPVNCKFVRLSFRSSSYDIQFEHGNTATPYEPYTGNTYPITFGQTVYSANLDVLTGKLSITHAYRIYNGSEDWRISSTGNNYYIEIGVNAMIQDTIIANEFENPHRAPTVDYIGIYNTSKFIQVRPSTAELDLQAWKTWLNSNNLKVVYELANPIEVQLTPTQITTLIGENVIFADVGDITECKYTRK